ncbi:MAG: DUF1489 domain-containing protein [Rhodospirillales bacterium]|nr:DUF1489 domain-containing protein [Rhodospirillales bacterium]
MLNLVKMAVGIESVSHLRAVQKKRLKANLDAGLGPLVQFVTRNRPTRAAEVLDGGSMYWIIKGSIRARQRILGLDPVIDHEGRKACAIRFDPELIETEAEPYKPIQGWRYLASDEAPTDRAGDTGSDEMPAAMRAELKALGLL